MTEEQELEMMESLHFKKLSPEARKIYEKTCILGKLELLENDAFLRRVRDYEGRAAFGEIKCELQDPPEFVDAGYESGAR